MFRGNRPAAIEDVLQRRRVDSVGMTSFSRLLELLRIASSTTLLAACDTAMTFASDICPASSTNGTSTPTRIRRDHSHAVPPTTFASPDCKRSASGCRRSISPRRVARIVIAVFPVRETNGCPRLSASSATPSSKVDDLVTRRRDANFLPCRPTHRSCGRRRMFFRARWTEWRARSHRGHRRSDCKSDAARCSVWKHTRARRHRCHQRVQRRRHGFLRRRSPIRAMESSISSLEMNLTAKTAGGERSPATGLSHVDRSIHMIDSDDVAEFVLVLSVQLCFPVDLHPCGG